MNSNQPLIITSLQNHRVKEAIHLRERHERDKTGQFIIEGYRETLRATDANWEITTLFICPDLFLGSNEEALINRLAQRKVQILHCTQKVFEKLSYRDRPDGLVAIANQKRLQLSDLDKILENQKNPLLVIAEAIEKPGNLGTILRSSDAVGADALIVCDRCTDIFNPNVVRASVGTLFTVPTLEANSDETLLWLKKNGIYILAATPHAEKEYTEVNLKRPIAIAVGTEQIGLSDKWMSQADLQVKIPMNGVADSLNVAMATTLLMYEALRQRKDDQKT